MVQTGRSCGTCTLCCRVLAIAELDKPLGQWCVHCDRQAGPDSPGGCTIYESRPKPCREFKCLWLLGIGPEELKPLRSHLVLQPLFHIDRIDVYCDPDHPDAFREEAVYRGLMNLASRYTVVVVLGDHGFVLKDGTEKQVNLEL